MNLMQVRGNQNPLLENHPNSGHSKPQLLANAQLAVRTLEHMIQKRKDLNS
jgi:hypothetical protein